MKKKSTLSFFDTNPFIFFCIIFAVMILATVIVGALSSEPFYLSGRQLLDSALLCAVPVITLVLFNRVPFLKYFSDDDCSPWISVPAHYVTSCALLLLSAFVVTRFDPVPIGAYLSTIFAYTQGYVIVVILAIIIEVRKMSNVNKNLKKIQNNLNTNKTSKGDTL